MKDVRELPSAIHRYKKWVFATAVRNENVWTPRKGPWQEPPGFDIMLSVPYPRSENCGDLALHMSIRLVEASIPRWG